MKCESAHKIVQVWREFDKNIDIQYRIDTGHQIVFLRIHFLGDQFIYVCKDEKACIILNGETLHKGSTYGVLKRTEALFQNNVKASFYNAIDTVPMKRPKPRPITPLQHSKPRKSISNKFERSSDVPIDKRPICMNCAYFSHCATSSSKRVGCESFVLK